MTAEYQKYILNFKRPSGTSRGVLLTKETFFLIIYDNGKKGIGECAVFRGLSADDRPDYEEKLQWLCKNIDKNLDVIKAELTEFPSIWIGYEQAVLNLKHGENLYFPSDFTEGNNPIITNGLIWMGDSSFMEEQIDEKLIQGFSCMKLKIGVDWDSEYAILQSLRKKYSAEKLELRVDANGGFTTDNAMQILQQLSQLEIHSIEQPIKAGKPDEMEVLCKNTPIPIALDEELIGVNEISEKEKLLLKIKPQYIILKPSLVGGFSGTDEWIALAENQKIGWWITSALESNVGLNAIGQYTYTKGNKMPQGLGTGALFTNNTDASLKMSGDRLYFKV